jgi:hypothetical protein
MITISWGKERIQSRLPKCTRPVVEVGTLKKGNTLKERERLTMYACLRHRQLRTLLDPTEGIEQLRILSLLLIDIGYE